MKAVIQENIDRSFAVVILAGGSSSRLGKPKQLLHYQNQNLIKHAVKTAWKLAPKTVIVVSGFLHEELVSELVNEQVEIVHNQNWQNGMGSSLSKGIETLFASRFSEIDAALILLCDQPLITPAHLEKLLSQFYSDKRSTIMATGYAETHGVPAMFARSWFKTLTALPSNRGAQWLLKEYQEKVSVIPFESAAIDIDTKEDYQRLLKLSPDDNDKE